MRLQFILAVILAAWISIVQSCGPLGSLAGKAIAKEMNKSYRSDCVDHDFTCHDCSTILSNRTVRFESIFNPGYMIDNDGSQKFVNKDKITEPDERVSWKLHGCGNGYLAMESLSPRHYYAYAYLVSGVGDKSMYMKYKSHSPCSLEELKTKICCQDCGNMHKCRIYPKGGSFYRPDDMAFHPNGIMATPKFTYLPDGVRRMDSCRRTEWKVWLDLPRDAYVVDKTSMCNRLDTDEKFGYEMTETVTRGSSHTVKHSVTTEVKSELLEALQLGGSGVTYTSEWQKMTSLEESNSRKITVGGLYGVTVRPNKRVVIKRLVAYYGEYVYKTNRFVVEEEDC